MESTETKETQAPQNFIRQIIDEDLASGKHKKIVTRFPPEPNGYLHIGHAKSICLNFGIARDYKGACHLRMDDTNPLKEDQEFVESIRRDVHWLGFDWGPNEFHAADYFDKLYECAVRLIQKGKAYVCDLSADQVRETRGTLTEPGTPSPYRQRSVEENLDLLERMKKGEFPDGSRTLRAKIDMASPNIVMRDPAMYRIRKTPHHRAGDAWCIYPMYDFAHCISDAIEGITHSLCTLEFENNRALYDWFLEELDWPNRPRQIEFSRLNVQTMVTSKRKLKELVETGIVTGWDDPRMPTLAGLRRRGVPPAALRDFCEKTGVTRAPVCAELSYLEECIRNELNTTAPRLMGVLRPLKVVITNYPEDQEETFEAPLFPEDVGKPGSRPVPFSRELYIDQDDFMENPPKKYFRLQPGGEVRLRRAYIIRCESVVKGPDGDIVEVHCSYDPATRSGSGSEQRKVKGTIHWVSARHAVPAQVRLYQPLFTADQPDQVKDQDWRELINPQSLEVLENSWVEPALGQLATGDRCQFERQGFFIKDPDSIPERPVFVRIVSLKDSWAKMVKQQP